jgi:hypothetical protein
MKHEMHAQSLPSIDASNTTYSNNEYVSHLNKTLSCARNHVF